MPVPKTGALPLGYTPKDKIITLAFAPYNDFYNCTQYAKAEVLTFSAYKSLILSLYHKIYY
uniref:Uncharacterized protein n=1 Tax=Bartonella rochalimae ATCC BAA-1498 TaxID=685782 RepID=E6YKR4_9HYPH|nr:hypothetical protein BARRO_30033 [Bartonella rochalimae ATCC BAA-1498]